MRQGSNPAQRTTVIHRRRKATVWCGLVPVLCKAILTVTAKNITRPYGTANPALTAQYGGFVNGDTSSVVSGAPTLTTTAMAASLPGTYPIRVGPGTLSATNYGFTLVNGTLTVSAITADSMSALVTQLLAAGLIDNAGIANSLTSKLSGISAMIAQGNTNAAKNQLNAFINELDAQLGKHIAQQAYDLLKAAALYLINSLP
jgi:MBG domain (YGX type)